MQFCQNCRQAKNSLARRLIFAYREGKRKHQRFQACYGDNGWQESLVAVVVSLAALFFRAILYFPTRLEKKAEQTRSCTQTASEEASKQSSVIQYNKIPLTTSQQPLALPNNRRMCRGMLHAQYKLTFWMALPTWPSFVQASPI